MFEVKVKSPSNIQGRDRKGILRIGVLLFLSAVSGCAVPQPETKQVQTYLKGRQNYCLGNMTSLGTGLVQAPVPVEAKHLSRKARRWTGWIRASGSGNYEFSLPDNGARILVNQQQIFMRPTSSSIPTVYCTTAQSARKTLTLAPARYVLARS